MTDVSARMQQLSRRDFLKATAVAGTAAAMAGLGAPPVYATENTKSGEATNGTSRPGADPLPTVDAPEAFDYEADLVVVGGGGAGLAAACTAAEKGAKVVLVEKNGFCGGATSIAMAAEVFGTDWQVEIGEALMAMPDSGLTTNPFAYQGAAYMMYAQVGEVSGQKVFLDKSQFCHAATPNAQFGRDTHITGIIYDAGPETFNWLVALGCKPSLTNFGGLNTPGAGFCPVEPSQYEKPDDWKSWAPHNGRGFTETLEPACIKAGVTILKSHPATNLITNANGVCGVVCDDVQGGRQVSVSGKAVVLASGGFSANQDMIDKYVEPRRAAAHRCWDMPGATGDGIRMAQALGAATRGLHEIEMWDGGVARQYGATAVYRAANQLARQKSMTVNKKARRFFDESWYDGYFYSYQSAQTIQQPGMESFTLYDSTMIAKDDIIEKFHPTFCEYPCNWFDETFAEDLAAGLIKKADTIAELAEQLGLDPAALQASIDHYNSLCDAGYDADFYKNAKYLHPIRTAPFYGVAQKGGSTFNTWGGLIIDDSFRVLDEDWNPIPNLYACGEQTFGGASMGLALPGGRLAGKAAAAAVIG
ncbi:MAG: FAD-dependent oxidoreductase [Coriobacteriia bacterium]